MQKLLLINFFLFLIIIPIVLSDGTLWENSTFNPSQSNVTYRINRTFEGINVIYGNETCLTINNSTWCNSSATDIIINITEMLEDTTAPIISNLRNISTTNQSSYIEWSCNENCNYSILWYNSTSLVNSIYNNTFKTSHNPYLSNLSNFTTYLINLTVWDSSGNSANNKTFNFTTAKNIVITFPPTLEGGATGAGASSSAGARGGGCDIYADQYTRCFYVGEDIMCHEGCLEGYTCGKDYRCYLTNAGMITSPSYTITVDVTEGNYKISTNVIANITIINKNNHSDTNGTLLSYMEDPKGVRYHQEYKELKFIPLACPGARYEGELCSKAVYDEGIYIGDSTFEPNKTMVSRKMALPLNATLGEWKFYVEFSSSTQPKIKLYDKFRVYTPGYFWIFIIATIILASFTVYRVRKKKSKKAKEKELEEGGIESL